MSNILPNKFQAWIEAEKNYRLTDAYAQMARELGSTPRKFGKYAMKNNRHGKSPSRYLSKRYISSVSVKDDRKCF